MKYVSLSSIRSKTHYYPGRLIEYWLSCLVGTMLAYSLTYHQERTPDGQYLYKLEP